MRRGRVNESWSGIAFPSPIGEVWWGTARLPGPTERALQAATEAVAVVAAAGRQPHCPWLAHNDQLELLVGFLHGVTSSRMFGPAVWERSAEALGRCSR